jgi:hypothetical protein
MREEKQKDEEMDGKGGEGKLKSESGELRNES